MLSLTEIMFCAEECERQKSGEMSVFCMCRAYRFAKDNRKRRFSEQDIQNLGFLVDEGNMHYRSVPVTIGDKVIHAVRIERRLESLVNLQKTISPTEFYKEFEEIHPFVDGNGRVGAILYNWLNGSLDNPVTPPEVFN